MPLVAWLAACAALALGSAGTLYADSGLRSPGVEWHQGRLSVKADGVPFREVLATVADATGVEMLGLATLEGSASISFADLPLRDGLNALLAHIDYAMLEDPSARAGEGRIVVFVVGQKSGDDAGTLEPNRAPQAPGSSAAYGPGTYQVVERLAEQGDVDGLREAATLGDPTARALAMQRLARQDPAAARRVATDAARSDEPAQRALAVQVLGGLDSLEATNAIGAALMDPDAAVRHAAVVALVGQRSPVATQYLVQALQDDAGPIRLLALELLAQRGAAGKPGVSSVLDDRDAAVRARAREVFGRMQPVE